MHRMDCGYYERRGHTPPEPHPDGPPTQPPPKPTEKCRACVPSDGLLLHCVLQAGASHPKQVYIDDTFEWIHQTRDGLRFVTGEREQMPETDNEHDKTRMVANQVFEHVDTQHISDADLRAYFEVVAGALEIHNDREKKRHGLWKDYSPRDQLKWSKIKVERIMHAIDNDKLTREEIAAEIIGEGFDVINYTIFAIRKARGEA